MSSLILHLPMSYVFRKKWLLNVISYISFKRLLRLTMGYHNFNACRKFFVKSVLVNVISI